MACVGFWHANSDSTDDDDDDGLVLRHDNMTQPRSDTNHEKPADKDKEKTRHPTLYFPDGDIVISATSAKDKNRIIFFRLDEIYLSRHSSVFKDMLSLPSDASTNAHYDGVPHVHLPDSAEDLGGLFGAIYIYICTTLRAPIPCLFFTSLLTATDIAAHCPCSIAARTPRSELWAP